LVIRNLDLFRIARKAHRLPPGTSAALLKILSRRIDDSSRDASDPPDDATGRNNTLAICRRVS
jgi:hypothetical protein